MCPVSAGIWVAPLHLQHSPAPAADTHACLLQLAPALRGTCRLSRITRTSRCSPAPPQLILAACPVAA
eukprot:9171214-Lingulodinium_polyedra.AAC.1